jgi:NAD/NADP transhydrogenase beta subunit
MGFLGTRAGPLADLALIISVAGFLILCLGVVYAKRRILLRHFRMTRLAVLLLIIAFIWMGPRFIGSVRIIIVRLTVLTALPMLITVYHAVIGTSALLAGIFLGFDKVIKKTRYPMRTVFLLWILALLLGIVTYIVRYIMTPMPLR